MSCRINGNKILVKGMKKRKDKVGIMEFQNKKVVVVGSGLSGIAAAKLLKQVKADVTIFEGNEKAAEQEIIEKLQGVEVERIVIGSFSDEVIEETELVVLSPGVPTDLPLLDVFKERNIPIWGEVELAYHFTKGKIAAITGTNGKTTTTALVGEIMKTYYENVFVVGNIGIPYTERALETTDDSVVVAEISSFQLETAHAFCPDVSAVLNITPDHLNRHHTMENYIAAKMKIAQNQTQEQVCVLNYEDEVLREESRKLKCRCIFFSSRQKLDNGIYLNENSEFVTAENGKEEIICKTGDLNLLGIHNYENVMAAIAIAMNMGVPMDCIRKAVKAFVAVEHRIEYVAEKNGVKYYNDSKGTNPDAAIQGIRAMETKTLLIGGGYDKGSEYQEWIEAFDGKVKYLVLLGQTADKIEQTARECGFDSIVRVETLQEAVDFCAAHAEPGESVLLSPACASWGMFKNYEERGNMFKEMVHRI